MERLPDLARLRYFLCVAETLNFREAADRLHVAQPAISRAVQRLEAELGYRLLDRTTRRVALTPAGVLVAAGATTAFGQLHRALREAEQVQAGRAGEVTVGYGSQAANGVMLDAVVAFRSAFPGVRVGLYLLSSDEQLAALASGRIDLGFLLTASCGGGLAHLVVARERFVVLVPGDHRLAGQASVRLKALAGLPFVLGTAKRWGTFRLVVERAFDKAGVQPRVVEEADDASLLLQLVALGRGVTLYGSAIVPSLPPGIRAVPVADRHAGFDVSLAWNETRRTPLMQRFIDVARPVAAALKAR